MMPSEAMKTIEGHCATLFDCGDEPKSWAQRQALVAVRDRISELERALKGCQTITPSLMPGDAAIERLKQINVHVYATFGQ
jgi:hypothetical protein